MDVDKLRICEQIASLAYDVVEGGHHQQLESLRTKIREIMATEEGVLLLVTMLIWQPWPQFERAWALMEDYRSE